MPDPDKGFYNDQDDNFIAVCLGEPDTMSWCAGIVLSLLLTTGMLLLYCSPFSFCLQSRSCNSIHWVEKGFSLVGRAGGPGNSIG